MIYLAAATGTTTTIYRGRRSRGKPLAAPVEVDVRRIWDHPRVGVMVTPRTGKRLFLVERAAYFGCDTGAFKNPDAVDVDEYLALLTALVLYRAKCLFATAPDRVGDHAATLRVALPVLPRIRALGLPAAFVAQDGATAATVPWDTFDVLFIGGSTAWKLSEHAYGLAADAKRRGKWCHMGRVNSWIRIRAAAAAGYDSSDGTCLTRNPPQYVREIAGWLDQLQRQPALPLLDAAGSRPATQEAPC